MSRTVRTFIVWLLAMLAGAAIAWNSRFAADMSFFLPAEPTAEQEVLVDQLREGAVSRLLMLAVAGGNAEQRGALSRALRARLAGLPEFVSVQNGELDSLDTERNLLFRHRYLLSPSITPERFTSEGLRTAIAGSIDLLASPAGMLFKPFLTRDPTGELPELLGSLGGVSQPGTRAGVWASPDGERALLLVQTRALGSDTDGQEAAIQVIRAQFAQAALESGVGELQLLLSGPGRFAVDARATIKDEVFHLTLISSLAIMVVLLFIYRSFRLLALSLLPVVGGTLAGVVAVSLAYGTVFGITVGFGAALIGEAVDYSTYYFIQSGRLGLAAWRKRFWPTIRLGVLTSVVGFATLLFSGFPGLAQLGLYALAGILTAALVTRFALPDLAGSLVHAAPVSRRPVAAPAIGLLRRLRWPTLALALSAIVYLGVERDQLWHPNLSALSTVSDADAALDGKLRADLGAPDSRYLVVVGGADRESALQAAERTGRILDRLVAQGMIGAYDTPARFLPSQATQTARRAALPDTRELRPRLEEALRELPLNPNKLTPFLDEVDAARRSANLTRADLEGSNLALAVDALMLQRNQRWSVLLPLRPAGGEHGLAIPAASVKAALAGSDALFIDMKGEFDALYNDYLDEAIRLSLFGVLAIVLLLAIALRSTRRLMGVLLPLALAVPMVVATLHLLGERLHLLHLIGLLLIVAVGSNYALFFHQPDERDGLPPETLTAMQVANLTTAIGFGTLAFSSVPVLHAIGVTVGPGAVLVLLLAAMFAPARLPDERNQ
jgi:predicted exporter